MGLTPKGRLAVQLHRLERAAAALTEPELLDLVAELEPIARSLANVQPTLTSA